MADPRSLFIGVEVHNIDEAVEKNKPALQVKCIISTGLCLSCQIPRKSEIPDSMRSASIRHRVRAIHIARIYCLRLLLCTTRLTALLN
jgi:hypothetical protein